MQYYPANSQKIASEFQRDKISLENIIKIEIGMHKSREITIAF